MTVRYLSRGHEVVIGQADRPCIRCGRDPLVTGEDACIGHVPGVISACCGHGLHPGYIIYKDMHVELEETHER